LREGSQERNSGFRWIWNFTSGGVNENYVLISSLPKIKAMFSRQTKEEIYHFFSSKRRNIYGRKDAFCT
jgi:hypothetical protein